MEPEVATAIQTGGELGAQPWSALRTLGGRIRAARHEKGFSQEALAAPEFTKSYVSAVERGKARPSLKALELMSRRLDVTMSELLAAEQAPEEVVDLEALEEDFVYQLDAAKHLIDTHRAAEAIRTIHAAEQQFAEHIEEFSPATQYGRTLLKGLAYLREGEPANARTELNHALALAQDLSSPQEVQRVQDAIGAAYFQQDMPRLALEQHQACLQAVEEGGSTDLNLRLSIYSHLASDFWALNDVEQAIRVYQESLKLLDDVNNLDRQSAIYWNLGQIAKEAGDLGRARHYGGMALGMGEAAHNLTTAAEMTISLAAMQLERKAYGEAERLLERARLLLQPTGHQALLSTVHEQLADLALQQGQVDRATGDARQSLALAEAASKQLSEASDAEARTRTTRSHARALRVSALVDEQHGKTADADRRFKQALTLLGRAGHEETVSEIEMSYADMLVGRGDHAQAATHYREASRHRQRRSAR